MSGPDYVQILGTKLTDEELQMQDDTLKLLETLMRDMEALFYKDKATGGNNRLASRAKAELDADRQGNDCPPAPPSSFPNASICLVLRREACLIMSLYSFVAVCLGFTSAQRVPKRPERAARAPVATAVLEMVCSTHRAAVEQKVKHSATHDTLTIACVAKHGWRACAHLFPLWSWVTDVEMQEISADEQSFMQAVQERDQQVVRFIRKYFESCALLVYELALCIP